MILPRLYPILDTSRTADVVEAAQAMYDGGATLLQLRHKGPWTRDVLLCAERIAALGRSLVINDRPDIAKILGAGVHLGQTDLPPREGRAIVGSAIVGYSTHNREQLINSAEEPIDYVALGPIFSTSSKRNLDPVVGVEQLRKLRPLTTMPLVAIGGITRGNALDVFHAGADSLAVIGDLYPDPPAPGKLRKRIEEWLELLRT